MDDNKDFLVNDLYNYNEDMNQYNKDCYQNADTTPVFNQLNPNMAENNSDFLVMDIPPFDTNYSNVFSEEEYQTNLNYYEADNKYQALHQKKTSNTDNLSIISLVLGIISIVLSACCSSITLLLSLAGIITAIISLCNKDKSHTCAIFGIVLSSLGLLCTIVCAIPFILSIISSLF